MHSKPKGAVERPTDSFNQKIVRVPLDKDGKAHAIVTAADYDRLRSEGVSGAWYVNDNGTGKAYVRSASSGATGGQITVARAILRAGPREIIRYHNGDRTDLRRSNLYVATGRAKRHDATIAAAGASLAKASRGPNT